MGTKTWRIRLDKIDRYIKICDGTTYLVLICHGRYEAIYDRIKFLSMKNVILPIVLVIIFRDSYS